MTQINKYKIKFWLVRSISIYVIASLVGCATPTILNSASEYSNRESKYWAIDDVTFAAIHDRRFVRLCVKLQRPSEEALTEIKLDLNNIDTQLKDQSDSVVSISNQESLRYLEENRPADLAASVESSDIKDSATKHYISCDLSLRENEQQLEIIKMKIEGENLSVFINEAKLEAKDEPALFILNKDSRNYLAFGASASEYPNLSKHVMRCYGEDQRRHSIYLLVPFAIVIDAAMIIVGVFRLVLCIIFFPCIINEASKPKQESYNPNLNVFSPPVTYQPECR